MTQTKAELLQTRHQGDIRLGDADSTHYVGFKAPATVGTSLVWTLPAADGTANYLLKTDGSGNLGWVADSSTDSTKMPLAGGTFTGNTIYNDNVKSIFGTGSDLQIYHDGTDTWFKNLNGHLTISNDGTNEIYIRAKSDEDGIQLIPNGAVKLYHNNVNKLETVSYGVVAKGSVEIQNGSLTTADTSDNGTTNSALFGTGNDLKIYHDGSNSRIANTTGGLYIQGGEGNIQIRPADGKQSITAYANTSVDLYYNNSKKFETTSAGVKITGGVAQVATAMGALEVDCNTSNYFTKTISGNSTFTFANPAASGQATAFTLELTHSSGTVTWPSSVKWNADTAPTLTTGKTHLFMFVTDDGGTRWRGSALVDYVN